MLEITLLLGIVAVITLIGWWVHPSRLHASLTPDQHRRVKFWFVSAESVMSSRSRAGWRQLSGFSSSNCHRAAGHPLLFCAGPVGASPERAQALSPSRPRRSGCSALRSARVPCGATRAIATGPFRSISPSRPRRLVCMALPLHLGARLGVTRLQHQRFSFGIIRRHVSCGPAHLRPGRHAD